MKMKQLWLLFLVAFLAVNTLSAPAVVDSSGSGSLNSADRFKRSPNVSISIYIPYPYMPGPFEHLCSGVCFGHNDCGLSGGCMCSTGDSGYQGYCRQFWMSLSLLTCWRIWRVNCVVINERYFFVLHENKINLLVLEMHTYSESACCVISMQTQRRRTLHFILRFSLLFRAFFSTNCWCKSITSILLFATGTRTQPCRNWFKYGVLLVMC